MKCQEDIQYPKDILWSAVRALWYKVGLGLFIGNLAISYVLNQKLDLIFIFETLKLLSLIIVGAVIFSGAYFFVKAIFKNFKELENRINSLKK